MIGVRTLGYLNVQRQKDAKILFKGNRYAAAVYLMGYAIEYALKRSICQRLGFENGFPELKAEFGNYSSQVAVFNASNAGLQLTQLRQIKNHDLKELLGFSGIDENIIDQYHDDWVIVCEWNPEDRYKIRRYSINKCRIFLKSARIILNQIKKFNHYE